MLRSNFPATGAAARFAVASPAPGR